MPVSDPPLAQTGHSRHYAWVEFKHPSVAKVAATTMDNYLLYGQVLRVRVVAPSDVHASTFNGCDKPFRPRPGARLAREARNAKKDEGQVARVAQRLLRGERARCVALRGAVFSPRCVAALCVLGVVCVAGSKPLTPSSLWQAAQDRGSGY
jgi:RNA recognition motif-containing protein